MAEKLTFLAVIVGPAESIAAGRRRAVVGTGFALGRFLVRVDEVVFALFGDEVPLDRLHVAQVGILLDQDRSSLDIRQRSETELFEGHEFVDDEGKVEKELLSADDRQVGEEILERSQAVDAVEQQIARDLAQLRVRLVHEALPRLLVLFDQHDHDEALHHLAALQLRQFRDRIPNVQTRTNFALPLQSGSVHLVVPAAGSSQRFRVDQRHRFRIEGHDDRNHQQQHRN